MRLAKNYGLTADHKGRPFSVLTSSRNWPQGRCSATISATIWRRTPCIWASALAPTEAEQKFWAGGAQNALEVELELHRDWLSQYPVASVQGPVTKHYVDHLQAVAFSGSYGEVVAAVLPCYWLYAEVGRVLHADYLLFAGEHPYGAWLATYADEAFAEATRTAIAIMDSAARKGSAVDEGSVCTFCAIRSGLFCRSSPGNISGFCLRW